jgi:AraC-like DNA-binding protein
LLKQIRDDFQISHIPVILLTAKNDDKIKIQSLNLGANAYITKPFSKKHLIARIEQLLNERKLFRERFWNKDNNSDQLPDDYGKYFVEKDVDFLNKTRQIIEENLDNSDFNIDAIASSLNLSRSAFFKKLKSITGLAPVDLVKDIRLNKAVELMKKTDMSISEIAFAVGFKDAGYFGKCFKKKYKLSPRDYLNTCKK